MAVAETYGGPGGWLWSFAQAVPWLAGGVIGVTAAAAALCAAGVAVTAWRCRSVRPLVAAFVGALLVQIIVPLVWRIWARPRPFVAYHFTPLFPHSADPSFPSGTTAFAAVASVVIMCGWRRLRWWPALLTVIVAIGCVYVGVHYISDVIAGAALGAAAGMAGWGGLGSPAGP